MEYENIKVIDIDGVINIQGNWEKKNEVYIYNGNINYIEPLFSILFFEYIDKKIVWTKSERFSTGSPKIYLNMWQYKDYIKQMGIPDVFNGNVELGKIFLLTEYGDNDNRVKCYVIYMTRNVIKIGRNGIWKIKKDYVNSMNEKLINKIQYGRTGVIIL